MENYTNPFGQKRNIQLTPNTEPNDLSLLILIGFGFQNE